MIVGTCFKMEEVMITILFTMVTSFERHKGVGGGDHRSMRALASGGE